jgi:hypothetical protein
MAPNQWGPPPQNTARPQRDHTKLSIWLAFAGTIITAIIGGVFAVVAARRGDSPAPAATGVAQPAPQRTTAAGQPPATGSSTGTGSSSGAGGDAGSAVRWSGRLVASTSGLSDAVELDTKPPQSVDDTAGQGDLSVGRLSAGRFDLRKAALGRPSSFAVWDGAGTPELPQCQEAAVARGVTELAAVETGAVLCVRTNEGRFARLTVQKVDAQGGAVTFDAVVWEQA